MRLFDEEDFPALQRFVWNLPKARSVMKSYEQSLSTGCWASSRMPISAFVAVVEDVVAGFALLEIEGEVDYLKVRSIA